MVVEKEKDVLCRRVSARLQSKSEKDLGKEKKNSESETDDENHSIRKRNRPMKQKRALVKVNGENPSKKPQGVARNENKVHSAKGKKPKEPSSSSHYNLVCKDLSQGLEAIPIPVINEVDNAPIAPPVILHTSSVINDLVLFSYVGLHPIMVHGGGPEINNWPRRLDIAAVFRDGLRVTDTDTMEIVSMVLVGKIKTSVSLINKTGAIAIGLSGMDDLLLTARPSRKAADLGFVGEVARVYSTTIRSLLETGQIPEVNSIAADETDQPYNIILIHFQYITSTQVGNNVQVPPSNGYGCKCKGGNCRLSKTCSCVRLNNNLPYTRLRKCSRLIKAKDIVFECGPHCGCGPDCSNRASQQGLKHQLEVYRTPNKGWAVRAQGFIPYGSPICELVGILRRNEDLDNVTNNEYITEIDCWETINGLSGRERRLPDEPLPEIIFHVNEKNKTRENNEPEFCIDSSSFGNVGRFINHSCEPSLFMQCILDSHYGLNQARLVLFAGKRIRPNQELTYDYGYQLDSVVDNDKNIKQLPCECGTDMCRKRLY